MKQFYISLCIFLVFSSLVFSQEKIDTIDVSFDKTVIVIFDSFIKQGLEDIGTSKVDAKIKENKIYLVANVSNGFRESNMFIETDNGGVYSFILRYNSKPKKLYYNFNISRSIVKKEVTVSVTETQLKIEKDAVLIKEADLSAVVKKNSESVLSIANNLHEKGVKGPRVFFSLGNMYVCDDYFYFKVDVLNQSNIPYDIDFFKFVIRNKKGGLNKSAVQDEELNPAYTVNEDLNVIYGKGTLSKVFAFRKFTMDAKENFHFELWEKGGDRKIEFWVSSNEILYIKKLK